MEEGGFPRDLIVVKVDPRQEGKDDDEGDYKTLSWGGVFLSFPIFFI